MWLPKFKKHKNTQQLRYLSQSVRIQEAFAPNMIRSTLMVTSFIIVLFIFWAAITKINEIAVAPGEVIPGQYIQSIQHLEGGIISQINVKEGDLVNKGQVLIKIDGTSVKQDLLSLEAKQLSLEYRAERLRAFVNHLAPDFDKIAKNHEDFKKGQMQIWKSMIAARDAEKEVIKEQILQRKEVLSMLEKQQKTLKQNLSIVEQEYDIKNKLAKKGAVSKVKFFEVAKELNKIKGDMNEISSQIIQARNSISEYNKRFVSLDASHRDEAYKKLDEIETDSSQNLEKLKKLSERVARLEIKSPSYGLVKSLNVKTIGGVINSGQVLVEIVPLEGNLMVESKIMPKDIGHVKKDQDVSVKISAYDFSRYGIVTGKLDYISATTFISEDDGRYYLGRISLDKNYVGADENLNLIVPGMTVQADIVTGEKSVLAYLLKPIHVSLNSAFKER